MRSSNHALALVGRELELDPRAAEWRAWVEPLWERFLIAGDTLDVLAAVTEGGLRPIDLHRVRRDLEPRLQRLCEQEAPDDDDVREARSLEAKIEDHERAVLAFEATIPARALRVRRTRLYPSEVAIMRYAALLARSLDESVERLERFELLAGHLLTRERPNGAREMRPHDEIEPLLDYLVPGHAADDNTRRAALSFFRSAAARLEGFQILDRVFSSGFYLDVRGYKCALREGILDRAILVGSAELELAIANKIEVLVARGGSSFEEVEARIAAEERKVTEIFQRARKLEEEEVTVPEADYHERHRERSTSGGRPESTHGGTRSRSSAKTTPKGAKKVQVRLHLEKPSPSFLTKVVIAVVGLAITAAAVAFMEYQNSENHLVALGQADLSEISDLLEEGGISEGKSEPVFVGTVSAARWMLLDGGDRRNAAKRIRDALARRRVKGAMIVRGDRPVVQIDGARVVYVE